jgi:hypothetical protein
VVGIGGIVKDECALAPLILHAPQLRKPYPWMLPFIEFARRLHQLQRGILDRLRSGGCPYFARWGFERDHALARNDDGRLLVFAGKRLTRANEVLAR